MPCSSHLGFWAPSALHHHSALMPDRLSSRYFLVSGSLCFFVLQYAQNLCGTWEPYFFEVGLHRHIQVLTKKISCEVYVPFFCILSDCYFLILLLFHCLYCGRFLFLFAVEGGDVVVYEGAGGLLDGHAEVVAGELAFFVFGVLLAEDVVQFS